jgi:hypothetical protein
MYAGALLFTVAVPMFVFLLPLAFAFLAMAGDQGDTNGLSDQTHTSLQVFVWILAFSTWVASWLIWSGYILLMGDL